MKENTRKLSLLFISLALVLSGCTYMKFDERGTSNESIYMSSSYSGRPFAIRAKNAYIFGLVPIQRYGVSEILSKVNLESRNITSFSLYTTHTATDIVTGLLTLGFIIPKTVVLRGKLMNKGLTDIDSMQKSNPNYRHKGKSSNDFTPEELDINDDELNIK